MISSRSGWLAGVLLLFLASVAALGAAPASDPSDSPPITAHEVDQGFRDGRVLVKLKEGVAEEPDAPRQAAEGRSGVSRRRIFRHLHGQQVLEFDSTRSVRATIKELLATGLYEFVEEDHVLHAHAVPNDPAFTQQWSLNNTGQSGGTAGADIGAVSAWNTLNDAQTVVVAVIDSGMRMTHSDLAANLWTNPSPTVGDLHGINATVTPATGNPTDDEGHGTHVSGTIGAVGNNSTGISGVAWKVQLMPLKFLDSSGSGSSSAELACFDYAIAHGAKIINGSFGNNSFSSSEFAALQRVQAAGIIFVVSAGNDGLSVEADASYPAGYLLDNIVTVAATTRTDALAGYSDFSSGSVDLGAPGDEIISTTFESDTATGLKSGTSMASPHVAGALALLKAKFPGDTYRQLINRLLRSTTKLSSLNGKVQTGGRLQLANALNSTDNRPFNDNFSERAQLAGNNIRVRSSNVGATRETGEPSHAAGTGGGSLWWSWTAPSTASVGFDTAGSSYDTLLAIYTGSAVGSLTPVASNDNATSTTSRVVVNVTAGTTYQIACDGKNGATGLTVLKIGAVPANDNFASAQTLTGSNVSVTGSTVNATAEGGEPKHAGVGNGHSVWYRWTATATGRFQLAAVSPTVDMAAAVYTGSSVSSLTLVAANDDSIFYNADSLVSFNATAGQVYYFAIDNLETDGGDFIVTLNDSVWQYPGETEITGSPAVAADGTAIVGGLDGFVYAVNPSGSLKWERGIGTSTTVIDGSSPAIGSDGTVYIGASDSRLYALNGTTGAQKWTFLAATGITSTAAIAADGTVYFRDDTKLYALTPGASSATKKWDFALSGSTYSSPAVATDGTVYVGATGGSFYAVNPNGTQKWKFTADGDIYTSPAIAGDGTVYFATLNDKVYALRPDGSQKWVWAAPDSVTSSPALGADGTLYFGCYDHKLHALGSDGVEKWSFTAGDEMRASSPAIASDGTIYFGDYDFNLYAVSSSGVLVNKYPTAQIIRSSPMIANNRLYVASNDAKLYAFPLTQNRLSSAWPAFHHDALHTGQASSGALVSISAQPQFQSAAVGTNATFSVTATGSGALSYQWLFNGSAIGGATGSSYTVSNAQFANSGNYAVVVTDSSGSLTSATAGLSVFTPGAESDSRLFAISCRAVVGTGSDVLIPGIAVGGSGKRRVVVRAVGPSIQGVAGTLARPQLQLYNAITGVKVAENIGWDTGGTASANALTAAFDQVGLTHLPAGSADCALLADLDAGAAYTAVTSGVNNSTGVALIEVYELGAAASHMTAISCRARVGTGGDILIPGIVIAGTQPKQLIIRAAGPALTAQGVAGALAQPRLRLINLSTGAQLAENTGWSTAPNAAEIFAATPRCGLVNFPANSADCVILTTLPPGVYTAQISGLNDTTGVSLMEVYEVP